MKKISSLFFSILVLFSLFPPIAGASFSDVSATHEHYAAIQWMEARGVVQGYPDGTFRPDQTVTRVESLKIILSATGVDLTTVLPPEVNPYSDVSEQDWFYSNVLKATTLQWVKGYENGEFHPSQTINWAEALKIISIGYHLETPPATENPYPDVDQQFWFAPYVAYAKARNYLSARNDGALHPEYAMTRGELIELMYRFALTKESGFTPFDIDTNWLTSINSSGNYSVKIPFSWSKVEIDSTHWVLWAPDLTNGQTSWTRTYPNSASVSLTVDPNTDKLSTADYFNKVMHTLQWEGTVTNSTLLLYKETETETLRDLYFALPNGTFLIGQASVGHGALGDQLFQEVVAIQESFSYSEQAGTETAEEAIEKARTLIQVDGQGKTAISLFSDALMIETDTIGIGTGPVDYYYSAWADVTLKYERSYDILLDLEEGQTTAF